MIVNIGTDGDFLDSSFSSQCWLLDGIEEQPEFGVCPCDDRKTEKEEAPKETGNKTKSRRSRRRRSKKG